LTETGLVGFQSSCMCRAGEAGESCHRAPSEFCSLELHRRPVAERLVQPDGVEPADVLDDGQFELRLRARDAVSDQLGLEGVDKLSARALSNASPIDPIEASTRWSSRTCVNA
jgi:hypothetical protein